MYNAGEIFNPLQDGEALREHGNLFAIIKHSVRGAAFGALVAGVTCGLDPPQNVAIGALIGLVSDHVQIIARRVVGDY
ncbi:hypothetical protein HOF56_04540 [Candidatus Peribacteria bacterium]|jgi:hypothetical protein|nr:hypothetical protein [Candidatus Peribacteria bacterium]MBT4021675.1 hypothetical protein [Candidatus Peribacteria bacterium]MBT4240837.1 hypothetical protein [Candidatus Peribacteria bacterium]MBT4473781.1 hypothetical protein [Candidatus Peribacteria bacterium]